MTEPLATRPAVPSPPWSVPDFPLPPVEPPEVAWVPQAFVTRFSQGPIHSYDGRPLRFMQGAVYDAAGDLLASSQKIGGVGSNRHLAADPTRIRVPRQPKTLSGTWLYGGHWNQHFGHFILETLTTLWPAQRDFDGIVFHKYFALPFVMEEWMTFLLDELGFGSVPIKIVGKQNGLAVEHLAVPGRAVVSQAFAHPQARMVWEHIAQRFRRPSHSGKVFLSRSEFHDRLRRTGQDSLKRVRNDVRRDRELDALFGSAGFQVVAPESLPMAAQIELVANADTIAGSSGSALHLSAFARRGTRVLELGDSRNPLESLAMQRLIAAVSDQPLAFVPPAAGDRTILDLLGRASDLDDVHSGRTWRRLWR